MRKPCSRSSTGCVPSPARSSTATPMPMPRIYCRIRRSLPSSTRRPPITARSAPGSAPCCVASAPGWAPSAPTRAAAGATDVTLTLSAGATLRGTVVDAAGQHPIGYARVAREASSGGASIQPATDPRHPPPDQGVGAAGRAIRYAVRRSLFRFRTMLTSPAATPPTAPARMIWFQSNTGASFRPRLAAAVWSNSGS